MPSKVIDNLSPHERLHKSKPDYTSLRTFGCLCYPFVRPYNKNKLQYRSEGATFLGYSPSYKGYKALLPSGKTIITRDIVFDELVFPHKKISSHTSVSDLSPATFLSIPLSLSPVASTTPPVPTPSLAAAAAASSAPHSPQPTTSSLAATAAATSSAPHSSHPIPLADHLADSPLISSSHSLPSSVNSTASSATPDSPHISPPPPAPKHHMITRAKAGVFKPKLYSLNLTPDLLPRTTLLGLLIPVWKAAMLTEFLAFLKNHTWTLTHLPPRKNLIGCTWVFMIKRLLSGCIARHKARLVAQSFTQHAGFDFNETFSPVVKPATIRLILSIAVSMGWSISHLDVNNAFLNGNLEDEIYMKQPIGFEQGGPHLVCKLNKAIYGLKQASRAWFFPIHSALISFGFTQSRADASLFIRHVGSDIIYLLIYVDDMLITGTNSSSIRDVIS